MYYMFAAIKMFPIAWQLKQVNHEKNYPTIRCFKNYRLIFVKRCSEKIKRCKYSKAFDDTELFISVTAELFK